MSAELIRKGKTKDVYRLPDGTYRLYFKDDVTGHADGTVDPGANAVVGQITGIGEACLRMTTHFFELFKKEGLATHFLSTDMAAKTMTVQPAKMFGDGVEVIVRQIATGSFIRRYGAYMKDGTPLDRLVEFTIKDDGRGDPLATSETLAALGIMTEAEYTTQRDMARKICALIDAEMQKRGLTLYDMKMEFGRCGADGKISLVDEISPGCMRVYRGDKSLSGMELAKEFFA
jgi:phosphoribosylaminoimidazole-succinocarboxamide synthase